MPIHWTSKPALLLASNPVLVLLFLCMLPLAACIGGVNVKAIGGGLLPEYEEPAPNAWTDNEAETLARWRAENPAVYARIQGHMHAWRAIEAKDAAVRALLAK